MGFVQHQFPPPTSSSALNNMYPFILDQSPGCCVKIFIGYLYSFPMWDPLQKIILKRRLFHIDVNVERVPQPPLPLPSHTHTHTHILSLRETHDQNNKPSVLWNYCGKGSFSLESWLSSLQKTCLSHKFLLVDMHCIGFSNGGLQYTNFMA